MIHTIMENQAKIEQEFKSDMTGNATNINISISSNPGISNKTLSLSKRLDYNEFHEALLDIGFFGKITKECDFQPVQRIFQGAESYFPEDVFYTYDIYFLPRYLYKQHGGGSGNTPDDSQSLCLMIPKLYKSGLHERITMFRLGYYGIPEVKTEFYFPYINNVFKTNFHLPGHPYTIMFHHLINDEINQQFRITKISKQYDVKPINAYSKIHL